MKDFYLLVFKTGIADFYKYSTRCPTYWAGLPEENFYIAGQKAARLAIR